VWGVVPIYLQITVNVERSETTSSRKGDPALWNSYSGRLKRTTGNVRSINAYLHNLQPQDYTAHKDLTEAGAEVTAEKLKNRILGKVETVTMLLPVSKRHNNNMAALVGNGYSPGTLTCFQTTFKHTESYITWKYRTSDIDIKNFPKSYEI